MLRNNCSNISNQNLQMFLIGCISWLFKWCTSIQGYFSCHKPYGKAETALFTTFATVGLGQVFVNIHDLDLDLFSGRRSHSLFDSFINGSPEILEYFSRFTLVFNHSHADFSTTIDSYNNFFLLNYQATYSIQISASS